MNTFDPYAQWLGIPPAEQPPHYYRLLGLPIFEPDTARIQAEADRRMQHVRTFQLGRYAQDSQKILNELASARVCLLEPNTKTRYDAALSQWLSARLPVPPPVPLTEAPPLLPAETHRFLPPEARALLPPDKVEAAGLARSTATGPAAPRPRHAPRKRSFTGWVIIAAVVALTAVLVLYMRYVQPRGTLDEAAKQGSPPIALQGTSEASGSDLGGKTVTVPSEVVVQAEEGDVILEPDRAKVRGPTLRLADGDAAHWRSTDDQIEWQFLIRKPGIFRVIVTYAADAGSAGGEARLEISGRPKPLALSIRETGGRDKFVSDQVSPMVMIEKSGRYTLTISAVQKPADQLMTLRRVQLHRAPVR